MSVASKLDLRRRILPDGSKVCRLLANFREDVNAGGSYQLDALLIIYQEKNIGTFRKKPLL